MRAEKKFPWLKRLLLVAACGFALFAVAMAVLIIPDQVRSIPESETLLAQNLLDTPEVWQSIGARGSGGRKVERREEEPMNAVFPEAPGSSQTLSLEALQERCRPVPDPSTLPEPYREAGEELNRAADAFTSAACALVQRAGSRGFEEEQREFSRYCNVFNEVWNNCQRILSAEPRLDPYRHSDAVNRTAMWDLQYLAHIEIAARNRNWLYAGALSHQCFGSSPHWRARTVSYLRQAGFEGRLYLAYISVEPVFYSIEKAFDPLANILEEAGTFYFK